MLLDLSGMDEASLRHLGRAAVPRLLEHLKDPAGDRRRALFALQNHWSADAAPAVAALLTDADAESRRMAAIVLDRQLGRQALAALCAAHADHADDDIAGFCFEHAESMLPDVDRVQRALARPALALRVARYLARYHDPRLAPATRAWLDSANVDLVRAGIVGLLRQGAVDPATRARVRATLAHADPVCREAAAEYCAWHGDDGDRAALTAAMACESDVHALAAERDAVEAIIRRDAAGAPSAPLEEDHATAEPHWFFRGDPPSRAFLAGRQADVERCMRRHGWPATTDESRAPLPSLRPARCVALPTRHTLAAPDDGFGHHTEEDDLAFKSLVHVGEDVSWYQDHATVVALADGRVRDVRVQSSWGYMVIVEHQLALDVFPLLRAPAERFARTIEEDVFTSDGRAVWACSLYAHLGPFVRVRVDQPVAVGAALGTVGRTFTWENGGYPAHLHVALHLGPYAQTPRPGSAIDIAYDGERYRGTVLRRAGDQVLAHIRRDGDPRFLVHRGVGWECGYIARWYWRARAHGWVGIKALLRAAAAWRGA